MMDTSDGAIFDAYIERHIRPLSILSLNSPNKSHLTKAATEVDVIGKAKAMVDDLEHGETKSLSSAFKCLYLESSDIKSRLTVMRKHQLFVITMNSKQLPHVALTELSTMYHVLTASRKFGDVSYDVLLHGVSPGDTEYPVASLISFNFFVVQAVLHLTSVSLASILRNDPKLNTSIFGSVSETFLSSSNLMLAVALLDPSLHSKYYMNAIKMVSGFLKVADVLQKKLQSEILETHISALSIKLAQLRCSCGEKVDLDLSDYRNASLLPFIKDFCSETKRELPILFKGIAPVPMSERMDVEKALIVPSDNQRNVANSSNSNDDISSYCTSISVLLNSLSKDSIRIPDLIESTISHLKLNVTNREDADTAATTIAPKLTLLITKSLSFGQLRQLGRLFFEFGKTFALQASFSQTCFIDIKCCSLISESNSIRRSKARIEYCLARILDLQCYEQGHKILEQYLATFQIESAKDPSLDLLVSLSVKCPDLLKTIYGPALKVPQFLQYKILERSCSSAHCLALDGGSVRSIFALLGELPPLSTIHMIAQQCPIPIEAHELPAISSNDDYLYTCSILLSGLEAGRYSFETTETIDNYLSEWSEGSSNASIGLQISIINSIMERLFLMGLYYMAIKHLRILLSFELDAFASHKLTMILGHSYMEVASYEPLPRLIADSGDALKKIHSQKTLNLNYNDILSWKLLQLKYFIRANDRAKFIAKMKEITKIVSSRPEYDFSDGAAQSDLYSRLQSLYVISEFLALVSEASIISGNHLNSLSYSRFAIKLLSSINRKLESLGDYLMMKKKVEHLSLTALQASYKSARCLGLLKEALHFLDEIKSLTSRLSYPGSKQLWCFFLTANYAYANKSRKALEMYEQVSDSVWDTPVLRAMHTISFIVLHSTSLTKLQLDTKRDQLLRYLTELDERVGGHKVALSSTTLGDALADLEYLISVQLRGESMMHMLPKNNSNWLMLINALIVTRSELSNSSLSDMKHLTQTAKPVVATEESSQKLVECKQILMRLLDGNYLSFLDIAQIHDVHQLLNRCVQLLSSYAVLKKSGTKDLLQTLFFLKDIANHLPFENQKQIYNLVNGQERFIPNNEIDRKVAPFHELKTKLYADVKTFLPRDCIIVTLDVCQISGNLLISRLDSQAEFPLVVQIPFHRKTGFSSLKNIIDEVKNVVAESNKSTKAGVTSLVKTKEDRKSWWKMRFELDLRLEKCLNTLGNDVIGGFMGIFGYSDHEDTAFKDFKSRFGAIMSFLPVDYEPSNSIVELFYNLNPFNEGVFNMSMLDDLLDYLGDSVSSAGFERTTFAKHLPSSRQKLKQLYVPARLKCNQGHLFLIPSFSCSAIPWESVNVLQGRSVSRMPSTSILVQALKSHTSSTVHPDSQEKVFYVVNPGKDLLRTQGRFEPLLSKLPGGFGKIGEEPAEKFILDHVFKSDLFIYMGHGGGEQYVRASSLMKASLQEKEKTLPAALLMGCSSSAYQDNGNLQESSNIFNWLVCGSPAIVTNLWDVTDKDIDTFSSTLFEKWGLTQDGKSRLMGLGEAMTASRSSCTLKYLNGAAPILHGLPLRIRN